MSLTPVNVETFRGLDLVRDPEEVGWDGAVDGLNFEVDRPGIVRSRDGFLKVTGSAGATRYDSVYPVSGVGSVSSSTASAGTFADSNAVGTAAWSPGTSLPSTATLAATTSHYLKATNFGFAVPSTATIVGVVASFTRTSSTGGFNIVDNSVKLVKGGTVSGTDKSNGDGWPAASTVKTFGSSSDLWGVSLTPTDVNGATFGVVLSATGFGDATVTAISITVYYQTIGNTLVAGATAGRLDVIATDGTVAATVATASDEKQSYVAFGSPTTSAVYIANRGVTMRKLVGTTFSQPAGMPKAKCVGLQTPDNRLVAGNIATIPTGAGSTASTSLVHFSDAGTPETWGANNFVYLTPGDNEDIQGIATWRDLLFVFKTSKYFVFYGNSTDSSGNPVFNFRQVTGAGMAALQAVTVAPEGVYFLDRRGIYFTTGGPPTRVSTPVDPLFLGGASALYQSGTINPSALSVASMCWYSGRLYTSLPLGVATANSHTLVHDPATESWTLWDTPMGAMAASLTQPGVLYFTYSSGTNDIGQYAPNAYTTDNGTAIVSRYRSGFSDVGLPGREKTVRQTELVGQGSPTFGWSRDYGSITSTSSATATLGTAPATTRALHRLAQNGELLSWQASASSGAWQLARVCPMLRMPRQPGDKSA